MSRVVLDASALLALLLQEPGGEIVADHMDDAAISAINLAEVVTFYARRGNGRAIIEEAIAESGVQAISIDEDLAYEAGLLFPLTASAGLSLGDCFCLALAKHWRCEALTADRAWEGIAANAGVPVRLIR